MTKQKTKRLADYLASYIANLGIKNVFMLSGTGSIHLDDAFAHTKNINYTCARHEAAATVMAEATAKLNEKIGVVIATTGPGGTNAIGGVVEAWVDSVPILLISGQVSSNQISKGIRSFGIQGFNIIENVKKITKYAVQVRDPNKIKYHLQKALFLSKYGRPGPVWIDIPFDVQSAMININNLESFDYKKEKYFELKNNFKLNKFFNFLYNSKKPVIIFGQGIRTSNAINNFKSFLKAYKIPSIAARMGIDILPYNNNFFFGLGGMRGHKYSQKILEESDLIIALGTSFTHAFAGKNYKQYNNKAKFIMVNIDKKEIKKPSLKVDLPIIANVDNFLRSLTKNNKSKKFKNRFTKWLEYCHFQKKKLPTCLPSFKKNPINSYFFIESINKSSKKNDIFVNDAGSANYVCSQNLRLKEGQREITSGAFYSMGLALPLAIGASLEYPNRRVIAITGDGSIELNIQELRTLALNNLNIKLFIINNEGYASIRKSQDDMTGGRYTDDEKVLNFSKIALAFELPYFIIKDYKELDKKIPKIFNIKGPSLVEVICDPQQEIIQTLSD